MSSVVILVIVLLAIALFCLVFIFFHNRINKRQANVLQRRLNTAALTHQLQISLTEEIHPSVIGLDVHNNKLAVCRAEADRIINLDALKSCRKQKKWLHIPAEKGARAETHLEKILLQFEFHDKTPSDELVFYAYNHNSIFQVHELEQKTDYWEMILNKQISLR